MQNHRRAAHCFHRLMVRIRPSQGHDTGSNPVGNAIHASLAQLDRASVYETEGYRFESFGVRQSCFLSSMVEYLPD